MDEVTVIVTDVKTFLTIIYLKLHCSRGHVGAWEMDGRQPPRDCPLEGAFFSIWKIVTAVTLAKDHERI